VIRLPQVCALVGLSRSMIYLLESQGLFPHRLKIGKRAVGWLEREVQQWVEERTRERTPASAGTSAEESAKTDLD